LPLGVFRVLIAFFVLQFFAFAKIFFSSISVACPFRCFSLFRVGAAVKFFFSPTRRYVTGDVNMFLTAGLPFFLFLFTAACWNQIVVRSIEKHRQYRSMSDQKMPLVRRGCRSAAPVPLSAPRTLSAFFVYVYQFFWYGLTLPFSTRFFGFPFVCRGNYRMPCCSNAHPAGFFLCFIPVVLSALQDLCRP